MQKHLTSQAVTGLTGASRGDRHIQPPRADALISTRCSSFASHGPLQTANPLDTSRAPRGACYGICRVDSLGTASRLTPPTPLALPLPPLFPPYPQTSSSIISPAVGRSGITRYRIVPALAWISTIGGWGYVCDCFSVTLSGLSCCFRAVSCGQCPAGIKATEERNAERSAMLLNGLCNGSVLTTLFSWGNGEKTSIPYNAHRQQ